MIDKKHCSRCKEEKEITEYYLSKGRYSSACKSCKSNMYKEECVTFIKNSNQGGGGNSTSIPGILQGLSENSSLIFGSS